MDVFLNRLTAELTSEPDWIGGVPCALQLLGGCTVTTCGASARDGGQSMLVNGGRINVGGGALPLTTTPNNMTGMYRAAEIDAERFMTGEQLGFTGEGNAMGVGAWAAMVSVPVRARAVPLGAAGAPAVIVRNQPFVARWTPSAAAPGKVAVVLTVISAAMSTSLDCRFEPAVGTGTIPVTALTALPAGAGFVDVFGIDSNQTMAGTYRIQVDVTTVDDGSRTMATFQ